MDKNKFLKEEFIMFSIIGGMGRGKSIYKKNIEDKKKVPFKAELKKELFKIGEKYLKEKVSEEDHLIIINDFSNEFSSEPYKILLSEDNKERFVIGRSQKIINLYLKYLWCWGLLNQTPHHCPFDSTIISNLRENGSVLSIWTELDSLEEYEKCVVEAKRKAERYNFKSIAEWELVTFNKERNY